MASGRRQAARRAGRKGGVRERWEATLDEEARLEEMTDGLIDRVVGPAWDRLGPLSAGAVAGSVVIVGARGLLRRLFGRRSGRIMSWMGAAALVPVALWLLSGNESAEDSQPPRTGEAGAGPPDGQPEEADG